MFKQQCWTENQSSNNEIDGHWLANHAFLGIRNVSDSSGGTYMPKVAYDGSELHTVCGTWGQMVSDGGYSMDQVRLVSIMYGLFATFSVNCWCLTLKQEWLQQL